MLVVNIEWLIFKFEESTLEVGYMTQTKRCVKTIKLYLPIYPMVWWEKETKSRITHPKYG